MARPLKYNPVSRLNVSLGGPKIKLNALSYGKLLEALVDGPCTYNDLVEHTGLEKGTVRGVMNVLVGKSAGVAKLARICAWDMNGRGIRNIMVFEWAPGQRDVPMPKMSNAERSAKYRLNKSNRALNRGLANFESGVRHDRSRQEDIHERT